MKKRIVLLGGGTAGHVMPNIALLPYLNEFEVHYVGDPNSVEERLMSTFNNVYFHPLKSVKFDRSNLFQSLLIPLRLLKAKKKARELLEHIDPFLVFSKGGYATLPIALATKSQNIPLIVHESDMSLGLANKLAVKNASLLLSSFSNIHPKAKHVGSPLRQSVYDGRKSVAENETDLVGRKNLLVFGGSSGSIAINNALYEAVPTLTKHYDIVHIAGKNCTNEFKHPRYMRLPYTDKIQDYYAWADLAVSRGGANALFELLSLKKPTLVIPLPKGVSRGDQVQNARYFSEKGCVKVLEQERLSSPILLNEILELDKNRNELIQGMNKLRGIDGTKEIARIINEFV
ncbi:MAG: UDP-N-acetylglucosamine--N-acetylmuramyl-(pentapeptide) pyrophosphoryl-undecaprenol N-acetylglucosamine transferase [Firmicutes bacterium]|nr:UDP-N-acetylglucosamine--N-acetylmuramyl-(pentapeptide) pyrophosphoryl-undecaprenol N-acetylglucosamine transferase [Bacillota bacterium]MCL2256263.1 UDP-N-acetylglucosamine--N-acetylmuramyl-(pentapeptide) pyrophosphoryl-undecaprenol N-acetylglucosamine transferase [Bacillota bacterium]